MPRKVSSCLVAALLALTSFAAKAEGGHDLSFGGSFSPKGCGVELYGEGVSSSFRLTLRSDFQDIIDGGSEVPGVVCGFSLDYPLKKWRTGAGEISLTLGPTVSAGYVRDLGYKHGVMAAIGCSTGANFKFDGSPLEISVRLAGETGMHSMGGDDVHDTTLRFYVNGLRRAWAPELTIRYRF